MKNEDEDSGICNAEEEQKAGWFADRNENEDRVGHIGTWGAC